MLARWS